MRKILLCLIFALSGLAAFPQLSSCTVKPTVQTQNANCLNPCGGQATISFPGILPTVTIRLNDGRVFNGKNISGLCEGNYTATVVGMASVCPVSFVIKMDPSDQSACNALQPAINVFDQIGAGSCNAAVSIDFPFNNQAATLDIKLGDRSIETIQKGIPFQVFGLCAGTYPLVVTSKELPCCKIETPVVISKLTPSPQPPVTFSLERDELNGCNNELRAFYMGKPTAAIIDNLPYAAGEPILVCPGNHTYQIPDELGKLSSNSELSAPNDPLELVGAVVATVRELLPFIPVLPATAKPCLSVLANVMNPQCANPSEGDEFGLINIMMVGGHAPYQYFSSAPPTNVAQAPGRIALFYDNIRPGQFTLTVIDSTGCYGRFSYDVKPAFTSCDESIGTPLCGQAVSFSASLATCPDSCNASVAVDVYTTYQDHNTATYQWSNGFNQRYSNTFCPGDYTINVSDSTCTHTISATVGFERYSCDSCPYKLHIESLTPPSPPTACNGSARVWYSPPLPSPAAGYHPIDTIFWSTGAGGPTANNLCLSNNKAYLYVSIQDSEYCLDTLDVSYTIVNCDSLEASIRINKSPTFGMLCGGELEALVSGGSGNYLYTWDTDPQTTSSIKTGVCPGLHTLTVNDTKTKCITTSTVVVSPPDSIQCLTLSFNAVRPACPGTKDGRLEIKIEGGTPPYRIIYENGATYTILGNTHLRTGLVAKTYSAVVLDYYNCYGRMSVNLSPASPVCGTASCPREIILDADPLSCPQICDGAIHLKVSSGFSDNSIFWSNGKTGRELADLCKGVYSFSGISLGSSSFSFCFISGSTTVGFEDSICPANCHIAIDTLQLVQPECAQNCTGVIEVRGKGGTGGYTYRWDNGSTAAKRTGLCADDYYVIVRDTKGCQDTFFFSLTNLRQYCCGTVDFPSDTDTVICKGESVVLTLAGGDNYQWSPAQTVSGNGSPTVILSPTVTTNYQVTIYQSGCADSIVVKRYKVTVQTSPKFGIVFSASSFCVTSDEYVPVSIFTWPTFTLPGKYRIEWQPQNRFQCYTCPNTNYLLDASSKENKVFLTLTDTTTGCEFERSRTVYVDKRDVDTSITRNLTGCVGTPIQLNTLRFADIGYIVWKNVSFPGLQDTTTEGKPLEFTLPTQPGTYTLKAKAYNDYVCSYEETIIFTVGQPPAFNFQIPSPSCNPVVNVTVSGYDTYTWSPSSLVNCSDASCSNVEVLMNNNQVQLLVTGFRPYCIADTTITLYKSTNSDPTGSVTPSITYTVSGCVFTFTGNPAGGSDYKWLFYEGSPVSEQHGRVVTHTFPAPGKYKVTLVITTASCGEIEKTIFVDVTSEDCACP